VKILLDSLRSKLPHQWQDGIQFVESSKLPNKRRALIYLEKLYQSLKERPSWLSEGYLRELLLLFSSSNYLADFLVKNPSLLKELKSIYRLRFKPKDFSFSPKASSKKALKGELLRYKNLQMARVVLRDLLGLASFNELVRDVTLIHDRLVEVAYRFCYGELLKKYGEPSSGFVVIDMGKAAGFELNYSSDLDLMFVYESRFGTTSGGSLGELQNHDFFLLLSREILDTLEGVVRTDTRLRPNGTMGPLANDILALEEYYTAVARPWERFALLRARPSVGELRRAGIEFLKLAKAFIYRKYVDLTLIEEVLRLKELIKVKLSKKRDRIDLKLGKGGIREVEFIVQAFQLIYGGKDRRIRAVHTLMALDKLFKWGYLTEKEYEELREAYLFLRRCEHMLQITNFRQTQTFHPESEEALELALKMGFEGVQPFLKELKRVMGRVNYYFNKFFPTGDKKPLSAYSVEELRKMGFREPEEVKRFIEVLLSLKSLTPEEVNRIDVMGEKFLRLLLEAPNSKNAMKNLVNFLEREEGELFFFSTLNQLNALNLLFFLLSTKDFFITRFRQTPELVDYIFQPELIEGGVSESSLEEFYRELGNLKLVKNLFEVVALLRYRLRRVRVDGFFRELTLICDFSIGKLYKGGFCLASLGKHGSREMNVGSDLDLLFIKGSEKEDSQEAVLSFIRELEELGYEVDTRLRPFGEKGELLFSLSYFKEYLSSTARLWERLAFTRFRFLHGSCREEAEELVSHFLFGKPLTSQDLDEIFKMRKRLEEELGKGKKDVKYAPGGVVDLEFIAYTYQLLRGKWLRHTLKALESLAQEEPSFWELQELYLQLREAESEKRLFGDFVFYSGRIEALKKRVRELFLEFERWSRREVLRST
jgi:glutamate-ammonia-ligase adenylyltransferase